MTTTCARGSEFSYVAMWESVAACMWHAPGETIDLACEAIAEEVNSRLPGSFLWLPHISEVYCDVEERSDFDEDEFWSVFNAASENVLGREEFNAGDQ